MTELFKRPAFKAVKSTFLLHTDPTFPHPLYNIDASYFNLLTYSARARQHCRIWILWVRTE